MSLKDDLVNKVNVFVKSAWADIPVARVIPTADKLTFDNTGIHVDACVFYADIYKSTEMVNKLSDKRAAETYKAFLHCAAKIIRSNDGDIVAYDGDRVMALFLGDAKADNAIRAAFQLHWAVVNIINPAFKSFYTANLYSLRHTVGIDIGRLLASKTGVRIDSDIVWVGPAANHASKLNSFPNLNISYPTRITSAVWDAAAYDSCFAKGPVSYWESAESVDGITYRRSNYSTSIT